MATPTTTVSEYCALAVRSRLLPEALVRQLHEAWQSATGGADADVDSFRKYLIRKHHLTDYQAALLQRGRGEGFFISGYKILDRIGSGQNASVYRAIHNTTGQHVALKVLSASRAKDQHLLNRFQREGRLLTQLDHPNVVRAYQLGQTGSVHFIVMEHLEGESLDVVLDRRKKLPADEAARLIYQALQGLEHLHGKRMVHRDLKPANLMVCPGRTSNKPDTTLESTVKVLDIGLGRELFDEDEPATHDLQLTGEGALLGTPDYLAPEQARDARNADIRADIYSLGCVLYHLIAGHTPFPDKNVMSQMVRHATEEAPPLTRYTSSVTASMMDVVKRLMEKDPAKRPATPADAAELLRPHLPSKARQAEKIKVLPEFQEWLESESMMEMPPVAVPPQKPHQPEPPQVKQTPSRPSANVNPTHSPAIAPPRQQHVPQQYIREEINVELVTLPIVATAPAAYPPDEEPRPFFDLDRRDFIMLGTGATGILAAIGIGFGLSRMLKRKDQEAGKEE